MDIYYDSPGDRGFRLTSDKYVIILYVFILWYLS